MPQAAARAQRAQDRRASARPRRTVTITGRPDRPPPRRPDNVVRAAPRGESRLAPLTGAPAVRLPRMVEVQRRRPPRTARERLGPRPDRIAMWAMMLAVFLVLVVAITSHAGS